MKPASLCLLSLLFLGLGSTHAAPPTGKLPEHVQVLGDVATDKGVLTVKSATATVVIGNPTADTYRVTFEIQPAAKAGANYFQVMPADVKKLDSTPAALRAYVGRDAPGLQLTTGTYFWDATKKQWADNKDVAYCTYWPAPTDKAGLALMAGSKLTAKTWHKRWLRVRVDVDRRRVAFWFDGRLVRQLDRPTSLKGPVAVQLQQGDQVRQIRLEPLAADSLFLTVDLTADANDRFAKPIGKSSLMAGGVPFELPTGDQDHLSLHQAQWIEEKKDPADYYEWYDHGPYVLHDPRMPLLRVSLEDYTAAHLLAVADDDPKRTNNLTLRVGRYGYADQVVQHEFPGRVPRLGEAGKAKPGEVVQTPAGPLFHVRVPLTQAIAQDLSKFLEIELTKEIRLARHVPDPNRFRLRPLGLPSGVRIAALTLERSPLQMRVGSKEVGHAFVEPQKPTFQIRLQNITPAEQTYRLTLVATHLDGTTTQAEQAGKVAAGATAAPEVVMPTRKRGYHDLSISLRDGSGRVLLERRTSFALLPPDTRKHRDKSPFGTWDFCGGHFTSNNPDETGPLYVKLGMHYGMFAYKQEQRKKYGILPGGEPVVLKDAKPMDEFLKTAPDGEQVGLIFHEHGISGRHMTRIPDYFHDRPKYKLDAEEQKSFKKLWDEATAGAKATRAKYPKAHLRFGNGTLTLREEFYRAKFPAALFDSAGNETATFGRPPETQPPDCVALNASLWMDRQLLDAHGYKAKSVTACYEFCYPADNPGNLSSRTQADYFVRHALHCLAWGLPHIKVGCITDFGNSYNFSNWGGTGFCRAKPELNVKPAFVAFATLTRVLDGATFVRVLPLGSASLYGMEFRRPDGAQVFALWTLHGKRPVWLDFEAAGAWTRIDDQGNETLLQAPAGRVRLTLTPTPLYLAGKGKLKGARAGGADYVDRPGDKSSLLDSLAKLDNWEVEKGRSVELEYYNFMCPRRQGDFAFETVAKFDDKEGVLKVTPKPIKHGKDTMPMYAVLAHKKGIAVPGQPAEIGAWVRGNSGWGRLIFELQDSSGQRWISIGAQQEVPKEWVEAWVPKDLLKQLPKPGISDWNTEDVYGLSRINFDGWRYLSFPLPGNYPGENHPWPANSQWRWDRDGVVHYPLTFRKLIVELPEKVLHVKTFAAPPRPEIYLKDLRVSPQH
jgi:hypothetical protein